MNSAILSVENLRTRLDTAAGSLRAVDGVDFAIGKGECFALVGESGCGKSMTALSIMRLLPDVAHVADGKVGLDGEDILTLPEAAMRAVRGRRVAMIFQEPATSLNPVLTVGLQIVEVITRHTGLRESAARQRALELLDAVGMPDAARRFDEYAFQLSGGLKQRVMIAAALAADPEVLIADEPTTALDVTIQAQILDLLRKLQSERGMAVLLITHDLGIVAQMAQRVAVMYAGEIVEVAHRAEFFRAPQHPYTRKLFAALPSPHNRTGDLAVISGQVPSLVRTFAGCRFAERCDAAFERCGREIPGLIEVSPRHHARCFLREQGAAPDLSPPASPDSAPASSGGPPVEAPMVLETSDLKVHFPIRRGVFRRTVGHVMAVDGVTLAIREGRTLALVGESGCGKTTVGKGILQLIRPTSGSVRHAGTELTSLSLRGMRSRRGAMQIIFQDPYASLNPRMRVRDILAEGMLSLGIGDSAAERLRRIDVLLEQVGLAADAKDRYPHEFSGGQRQRIAIARALAVDPRLIICDEPTSALDVSVQAQILNLLRGLQRSLGVAYLFITHNIATVAYLADEVAVMYLGRIVERGSVDEVLRDPRHPYTVALLSAVPSIDGGREMIRLSGELPSPARPPQGCHFHPRCPKAQAVCRVNYPAPVRLSATRSVSCVLFDGTAPEPGGAS